MDYEERIEAQRSKYKREISKLQSDIEELSIQIADTSQSTINDDLLKQSSTLQLTIYDLENQNDLMQNTIESYEEKLEKLQSDLSTIAFQVIAIKCNLQF